MLHTTYQTVIIHSKEVEKIRLLIVDDHAIVRKGITMFLNTEATIQIVGEAVDGVDAVCQAEQLQPDVILMDIVMPKQDGIETIIELRKRLPAAKIIILSNFNDEGRVSAAIKAGAHGYLLKDADGEMLLRAIHAVKKGGIPMHPSVTGYLVKDLNQANGNGHVRLTEREREVLELLAKGWSNKKIAQRLHLSTGTIKIYVGNILNKLKAASRGEAARRAIEMGLVSLNEPLY